MRVASCRYFQTNVRGFDPGASGIVQDTNRTWHLLRALKRNRLRPSSPDIKKYSSSRVSVGVVDKQERSRSLKERRINFFGRLA